MQRVSTLHLTNGDCTVETLRKTGLGGDVFAWRDALHEGPVPAGDRVALRGARAGFLADSGWGSRARLERELRARDERLAAALGERPVVLWFEHDLYDQLQLLEILSFVDESHVHSELLTLIVIDSFPGRPGFKGLGELDAGELESLWPERRALSAQDLAAGRRGWAAFTAPDPDALEEAWRAPGAGLPLLPAALRRLLEEYPGVGDGLSRSERQILQAVEAGAEDPMSVFHSTVAAEESPYSGDVQVWDKMRALAGGARPLLEADGRVRLTADGARVLAGDADTIALRGIDRWIGGVHLTGDPDWRWDGKRPGLGRGVA
jgi:hypothetical protein